MSVVAASALACAAVLALVVDAGRMGDRPWPVLVQRLLGAALALSTGTGVVLTVLRLRDGG